MNRYFDLYLTAGHSVPVVINANQYDSSETWIFTLYTEDDQLYTPASGSIVGLKSDGHTIANAGTVNNDGQVVIQETVQITAAKGINVFELVLDGNHGTANFVVLVEPRPGDNVTPSDSELTLMEQAIAAAGSIEAVSVLQETVNSVAGRMDEFISSHAGLANETILWEGTLGGTGSVTLSEDASTFDTIAIYTQAQSNFVADTASEAHYFKASDWIANNAIVTVAVANTFTQTSPATAVISAEVGISGTQNKTFDLIAWKNVRWSGVATDDAEIAISVSGAVLITKVVGIKNEQADTEVLDARVGADGTTYSNLEQRLNAENLALKSAINAISRDSGLTETVKQALLSAFNHVIWDDDDPTGQTYIDDLEDALYPPTNLTRITAVYTQSGTVYDTDSLDSLKSDLVVRAYYDNGTDAVVTSYALSGTLTAGTSTITVTYSGKTTTFNVTVTSTLIYSFDNHVFDGTVNTAIDTNIALTSADRDFTILVDLTTTVSQDNAGTLVYRVLDTVTNVDDHLRGVSIVRKDLNSSNFRWCDTAIQFTDFSQAFIGNVKFAIRHTQGSGYATLDVKAGSNSAHQYTASSTFYSSEATLKFGTNSTSTNALFGTASGKVYSTVLSNDRVTSFLNGVS